MGTTASKDEDDVHFTRKSKSVGAGNLKTHHGIITTNSDNSMSQGSPRTDRKESNNYEPRHNDSNDSNKTDITAPLSTTGASHVGTQVADDQIHINLAMADLMAYLQVVASNSSNLPLTRRDDPELGRTVSTLTAEEYATKSAAFIPSDVRVIGGSFLKYGRVWDLPTSEEFTVSDGAQEPGLSYGGACCNSFLKVLYDIENEESVIMGQSEYMDSNNLFDDDDENISVSNDSCTSLDLGNDEGSGVTWTQLLRKMKEEMREVGFSQVPTITSSRKFDLNQPFSFFPENFDPTQNKKLSLLIGCNYNAVTDAQIKASHDDVRSVKDYIVNVHGFPEKKGAMTILLDDKEHSPPTHSNIIQAFKHLAEESKPGDAVFIQFSGHGGRVLDTRLDSEGECYDEVLIPSDFTTKGLIRDTLMFKTLLAPMRDGVTVTILLDCCDTGVMLDLPYAWTTKNDRLDIAPPKLSLNDNFSFVRFLKVVKTMYEMSTFTQLGRTVGSALNEKVIVTPEDYQKSAEEATDVDDETLGEGSLVTMDDNDTQTKITVQQPRNNKSLFSVANCFSPSDTTKDLKKGKKRGKNKNADNVENISGLNNSGFLQKVMNCTLANNCEEDSDEDTFQVNRSVDEDHTFDDNTVEDFRTLDSDDGDTYGSITEGEDDDYMPRSRNISRSIR